MTLADEIHNLLSAIILMGVMILGLLGLVSVGPTELLLAAILMAVWATGPKD